MEERYAFRLFSASNGASLSYAEYGTSTGNPVLLFHGLVGSICSEGMEESLCGLPVRVIALARPGYGASDYFDMDCVADWGRLLAEFWDHLELWSFDIVGISAGAPYAIVWRPSILTELARSISTAAYLRSASQMFWRNIRLRMRRFIVRSAVCHGKRRGRRLYDSYLPLFPEAALQSRDFRDSMGSDLRNIGQEAKLQEAPWDLSCLRCGVRLYCFMEQPIPRCLTVPWRRLPKNFLMPALSNWRGKSTHPPQSRTD